MPVRLVAVLAVVLAAACAPVPSPAPAAPPRDAAAEALVTSLSVRAGGDSVRLTLQVTNATDAPLTLAFPSGQTYDFAVLRGGETLWTWSADRSFLQALRSETLAAGETRTYTEAWPHGPALRGELTARGWLTSSSHPAERTAAFRLP
jgi:hypothetical protein